MPFCSIWRNALVALFGAQCAQIIQLGLAQHLHPVRVDQVEMADEPLVGGIDLFAVDDAVGAVRSGNTAQLQSFLLVFKQLPDVDLAHVTLFQSWNN